MRHKRSLLEDARFLIIIGILAGAIGGLAVGVVTGRSSGSTATASH